MRFHPPVDLFKKSEYNKDTEEGGMPVAMRITDETLMGTFEQKRELVRSFTMFDDDFFAVVMEDKAAAQEVLRVLTGIEDLTVLDVKTQYSIRNFDTHSVVLDALAEDSEHRVYNMELQVSDRDDHQKRMRYYQANIDISYLDKGKNYEELPEVYLIYMTKFDLFKMGRTKYVVDRVISGTDVVLDNGAHELYITAANHDGTAVAELMQFFTETGTRKQQFPELSNRIQYLKEEKKGVTHMCEAVRKYGDEREDRGRLEGMQQERMETIREALKMKMPAEGIAKLVRLPVEEVRKLIAELEQ